MTENALWPDVLGRLLRREDLPSDLVARALETMAKGGVSEALVIGGDEAAPNAGFDSSLEVLQTGLFDEFGFRAVGVAGHL